MKLIFFLVILTLFTSCTDRGNSIKESVKNDQIESVSLLNNNDESVNEMEDERLEELENSQLDTSNIDVAGVKGELLEAVMKQITESNEEKLEALLHPKAVIGAKGFYDMTRQNKSVTKLVLDHSRVSAIKEEFGLDKEQVQMVTVHMTQRDGQSTTLNLIYIYSSEEWLLFRID